MFPYPSFLNSPKKVKGVQNKFKDENRGRMMRRRGPPVPLWCLYLQNSADGPRSGGKQRPLQAPKEYLTAELSSDWLLKRQGQPCMRDLEPVAVKPFRTG